MTTYFVYIGGGGDFLKSFLNCFLFPSADIFASKQYTCISRVNVFLNFRKSILVEYTMPSILLLGNLIIV